MPLLLRGEVNTDLVIYSRLAVRDGGWFLVVLQPAGAR